MILFTSANGELSLHAVDLQSDCERVHRITGKQVSYQDMINMLSLPPWCEDDVDDEDIPSIVDKYFDSK